MKRTIEETRAAVARRAPSSRQVGAGTCLVMALLLVLAWGPALAVLGGGTVGASHYDEANMETGGENNATIFTYGDRPMNEQRAPGEGGQSYWNQNVINFIEEDGERAYLNQTMVWRPVVSACEVADLDNLGVDRGSTYQDERRTDEEKIDSIEDSDTRQDVRDRWESEWEGAGDDRGDWDLVGPDAKEEWDYVELVIVDWRTPSEFPTGPYFGLENGDRAVAAQSDCFTNPNEPGWYRWAWTSDYEFEDGSMSESDAPSFSHWYYICDCEDEEEAREVLGPPPSEQSDGGDGDDGEETATPDESDDGEETATPDESDDGEETATPDESDDGEETATPDESDDGTGDDGTGDDDGTSDDDGTGDDGVGDDTADTDDEDATPDDTPGFGPVVAVIAFVAITLLAWYRS